MTELTEQKFFQTKEVIGKHLITLDGEDLGTVARLLVSPASGAIAGLTVNAKGWFKGEKALEFSSVSSIGNYAVTIENKNSLNSLNNFSELEQYANDFNIYNIRVITPTGELLGIVEDFTFEAETGQIESFLLSGGLIKNLIQGKAELSREFVQKIGPDVIIAKETASANLKKSDPGLTDNFDSFKDNVNSWKESLEEFRGDAEKSWDVTLSTAKDVTKRLGGRITTTTSAVLAKSKTELTETYEHWSEKLQNFKNRDSLNTEEQSSLIGKKAGHDIYDSEGRVIVEKDADVTAEVLEKVQKAGKTKELLLSIATGDVAAKLENLQKDSEGI